MPAKAPNPDAPARRLVAVTGATGFVGGHLIDDLLAQGHAVRALTRRAMPARPDLEWVAGDLTDSQALQRLCAGADALIHGAALIKARRAADFNTVNVEGTRAVLDAARAVGLERVVLLSSLAARQPALSAYAASKHAAEALLRDAYGDAFRWTILRAPAVYGPGDRETLKIFKSLRWRMGLLPNRGGRVSLVHVADLCAGIGACLDLDGTAPHLLEICDQTPGGHDLADLYRLAGQALGVKPLLVPVPRSILMSVGALNEAVAAVIGHAPMLSRGKARELAHADWVASSPHLCELGSWQARIDLAEGLAQTLAWYQARGWL
ncbi:MAG: NAD-dependent epimerase/dehydratase family protein [Sphingomonadales bacterium]